MRGIKKGGRRAWRERAAKAVVDEAAQTWVMDLSAMGGGTDEKHDRQVVDLTLRLGAMLLGSGATAAETTSAMLRLTHIYGLHHAHVDVSYTSVFISYSRDQDADPLAAMRSVSGSSRDYARLGLLEQLVTQLADSPVPISEAHKQFEEIAQRPRRYRNWVTLLAQGFTGLGISLLLGAGPVEMLISMLSCLLAFLVVRETGRRGVPAFFAQVVGGAVPTSIALLIVMMRNVEFVANLSISPSRIVAAGIVVLVAGTAAMNAARDLIDGYYVTASARTFQVAAVTMGIVLGVSGTLWVGQQFDIPGYISTQAVVAQFSVLHMVAAGIAAAANAVTAYSPPRAVLWAFGVGAGAWGLGALARSVFEVGYPTSVGMAAIAVGFVVQFIIARSSIPDHAIAVPAMVSMVPGSMIYRGLNGVFESANIEAAAPAITELLNAAATGLGLAFGIALGAWIGRPIQMAVSSGAREFGDKGLDRQNPLADDDATRVLRP